MQKIQDQMNDQAAEAIAKKYCSVATLEVRSSDSLDFHEVSVWGLRGALQAAYAAGIEAATPTISVSRETVKRYRDLEKNFSQPLKETEERLVGADADLRRPQFEAMRKLHVGMLTLAEMELACQILEVLWDEMRDADRDYIADEYDFDDAAGAAFLVFTELEAWIGDLINHVRDSELEQKPVAAAALAEPPVAV